MLPDANNYPSSSRKPLVSITVTPPVARYLVGPELGISRGDSVVLRATMPKTAINKHCDPRSREDEVGGAS
jgi:hypothetical protein